jgi:GMP synthase (glutamine-hydrolysing)
MILVLDNEIDPDLRYLGPELVRALPTASYLVYPEEPVLPAVDTLDGVVLAGSTASVYDDEHARWIRQESTLLERCIEGRVPVLGICFGHQLVNHALGGRVVADEFRGGFTRLASADRDDCLLSGIDPVVPVLHGDIVVESGSGMRPLASTQYSDYFCTRHESAPVWTVQFHPELTPAIAEEIDEFSPDEHSFAESNADIVLENFARRCVP